jgi:cupin superfamily acireductone dioxygenase involved in methionine salvage
MDAKGFHHFYFGLLLCLTGFLLLVFTQTNSSVYVGLFVAGDLIMLDDFVQHWIQRTRPTYRSIFHRLYGATLWRIAWIRKLNEFFDKMFGR